MADASPNSAKDLEIVEEVKEEEDDEQPEEADDVEIVVDESEEQGNSKRAVTGENNLQPQVESTEEESEEAPSDFKASGSDGSKSGRSDENTSSLSERAIRSRVFVGHLDTEQCSRKDVMKLFGKCGRIKAVSLQHGYGFVQYENTSSALRALEEIHGTPFFGMSLVVDKPLMWKKLDGEDPKSIKPRPESLKPRFVPEDDYEDEYYYDRRMRARRHLEDPRHLDRLPIPSRFRDPEYERYLEMRYMEEMLSERYHRERLFSRHPSRPASSYPFEPSPPEPYPSRYNPYPSSLSSRFYDRPRDDFYDRVPFERERRPFDRY